jgi:hypothetical protein
VRRLPDELPGERYRSIVRCGLRRRRHQRDAAG